MEVARSIWTASDGGGNPCACPSVLVGVRAAVATVKPKKQSFTPKTTSAKQPAPFSLAV